MPFISKDWRSPGEEWVKTDEGWEKKRVLECMGQLTQSQSIENNELVSDSTSNNVPPHCHITIKCTREIAGFNGLGEAVRRLDFVSAVRDVRRFHYICALLRLLVTNRGLTGLPGGAQRLLLTMLEEVATQVSSSQQNLHVLRGLLLQLRSLAEQERGSCWGRPLGSKTLWVEHLNTIQRILDIGNQIQIREPGPEINPKLHNMPEECVREILLRISDHRDLEASSAAWGVMAALCGEQRIWRELTNYHFTSQQIDFMAEKKKIVQDKNTDWQRLYHALRRTFGLREDMQYAETLSLCRHCRCLFWPSAGHPCIADQSPEFRARIEEAGGPLTPHPVPPAAFLKFFSL
ncbi:F-box only protein 25-like isoform X3 [Ctenocephalides felis]|uniref:F-box only protein 25-like isoform X3 n=1 Tax=Ctenocephalides felis TaxID=7515 RepID=UPI000E6E5990|nr:F-box only protein 25-like isoform X3 [Ctenocephalides felis]